MGRHFFINRDSGTVTSYTDEELAEGGLIIGAGVLIYALYGLLCIALGAILVAPFVTLFLLEGFVETVVHNNWLFFLLVGGLLVFLKLISFKTSRNLFVRFLFNTYIVMAVLYLTLYVLHFDAAIYSFARVIGNYVGDAHDNALLTIFQSDKYYALTEGNWFYETIKVSVEKIIDFVMWSFGNVIAIDNSCFSVPAAEINIFAVLKTCIFYVGLGGFAILGSLLFIVILLVVAILSVALPYCLAFIAILVVNAIINKLRFPGKNIKFGGKKNV